MSPLQTTLSQIDSVCHSLSWSLLVSFMALVNLCHDLLFTSLLSVSLECKLLEDKYCVFNSRWQSP